MTMPPSPMMPPSPQYIPMASDRLRPHFLQRLVYWASLPMALLLPALCFIGHGSGGWIMIIMIGTYLPALLICGIISAVLILTRYNRHRGAWAGMATTVLQLLLWLCAPIAPMALGDAGDIGPGVPSRLEQWGMDPGLSSMLGLIALIMTILLQLSVIIAAAVELRHNART